MCLEWMCELAVFLWVSPNWLFMNISEAAKLSWVVVWSYRTLSAWLEEDTGVWNYLYTACIDKTQVVQPAYTGSVLPKWYVPFD